MGQDEQRRWSDRHNRCVTVSEATARRLPRRESRRSSRWPPTARLLSGRDRAAPRTASIAWPKSDRVALARAEASSRCPVRLQGRASLTGSTATEDPPWAVADFCFAGRADARFRRKPSARRGRLGLPHLCSATVAVSGEERRHESCMLRAAGEAWEPSGESRSFKGMMTDFDQFVAAHVDDLLRTAYLIVWDEGEAEDIVQECLLKVAAPLATRPAHGAAAGLCPADFGQPGARRCSRPGAAPQRAGAGVGGKPYCAGRPATGARRARRTAPGARRVARCASAPCWSSATSTT